MFYKQNITTVCSHDGSKIYLTKNKYWADYVSTATDRKK